MMERKRAGGKPTAAGGGRSEWFGSPGLR